MVTYTTISVVADVTEEVLSTARDIVEGWYNNGRVDWENVWDRMDGSRMDDGTTLDMGGQTDTPAMRKIQRTIRKEFREG